MTKKLWGTRFAKKTHPLVERFTTSISYDSRLAKYDVLGSIAHAQMLAKQRIISKEDAQRIINGLKAILKDIQSNKFKFDPKAEDIHSNIQDALYKKIGKVADKLHTARSRNDQVVLDVKMYLKEKLNDILNLITQFQSSILSFAKANIDVVIPAYTHLQRAQCVLLAHQLLAYLEGLERDKQRLTDAYKRLDSMPLGSCALAGTGLPIDREWVRKKLGFSRLTDNSIDSVSDRDFILEVLAGLSILAMHLSRIAEDLILWSTEEFDFIEIDPSFCTGSSIMPHKKNPDVLELIRGYTGRIYADFSTVFILMKGLAFSYNRDMQLDKIGLFDSLDTIEEVLRIFKELFKNIIIKKEKIKEKLNDESLFSVDIVEYLIKAGLSYRQAHDIVGRMIKECLDKGKRISDLSIQELKRYSEKLSPQIRNILHPQVSVSLKNSYGSTNPRLVKIQLNKWEKLLK